MKKDEADEMSAEEKLKKDVTDIIEAKLLQLMLEKVAKPAPYITVTSEQAAGYKERVLAIQRGERDI